MALIVQKYGGSSVGTLARIQAVAEKVCATRAAGHDVVVVVSAMQGDTDRLIQLAHQLLADTGESPLDLSPREYDALIATGEQVSIALLAMAIIANGYDAISFTGPQVGILTDSTHTKARILEIKTERLLDQLRQQKIIVIAGFQGQSPSGELTTLGRGGSDTTAVAIAAALKADECQIYTDVDGVYSTDPRIISQATLLSQIAFDEMLEMASLGAKVLQIRSVELAKRKAMPIRVLSTFKEAPGTLVTFDDKVKQQRVVTGIAFNREEACIQIENLAMAGLHKLLQQLHTQSIEIDMLNLSASTMASPTYTFTISRRDTTRVQKIINQFCDIYPGTVFSIQSDIAKLSLIGVGLRSHPTVLIKLFEVLEKNTIRLHKISTTEIKISLLIDEILLENCVAEVHRAFALDEIYKEDAALNFE